MRAEFTKGSVDSVDAKNQAIVNMIDGLYATIEFDLHGTILQANQNFLSALEYTMNEIVGQKHRMFVDDTYGNSAEYADFWSKLRSGEFHQGQFPRVTKSGSTIWIQATYSPVLDADGNLISVMKIASDVTPRRKMVNELARGLTAIGEGDLRFRIEGVEGSDINDLADTYNFTVQNLNEAFSVVKQVADGIAHSAKDVEQRSNSSADSTLRTAASFEEASAEVQMVATSVNTTSESATVALQNTEEAAALADVSAEAMAQALEATIEMRQSTAEMSGINDVIDSIAFQTNLLALNAGIEAARAGPSGAGFAVVATEIRNLASRSQDASSKIQGLIARSVDQAKTTEGHVKDSEVNIKHVQTKSREVAERMTDISAESTSQAKRVTVISETVRQLAKTGERGAQVASENQDSAQALAEFSIKLTDQVSRFALE